MKQKGILIVISGPSGTGKGTICKVLAQKDSYWISVSATSRKPRTDDVDGLNYFFLTVDEFKNKILQKDFLEYAQVYGNYYGTPKSNVLSKLECGDDVILEIDIQGALKIKETFPDGIFIFILPPSMEELKKRITERGSETAQSLMTRFKSAYKELNYVSKYNYAVVNTTVENAVNKIESIIIAEKCRVDRMRGSILDSKEGILHERCND